MNNNKAKYITVPFLILIFGVFSLNVITPEKYYSEAENRNLEKFPTAKDIKNNTFIQKFENYFTDQFVFRDDLIKINKKSEIKLNKSEVGNYYLCEDNWILGKFSKPLKEEKLDNYTNALHSLAEYSNSLGKDIYYISTPHKTNMLKHLYPEFVNNKDGIDNNKDALKGSLESDIIPFIDLDEYFLNQFNEKQLENMYFKTDHHWNGVGAFEGFKEIIRRIDLGISNEELNKFFDKYKTITVKDKKFIGSYNRNLDMLIDENEYASYVYLENAKYKYYISNGKKDKKVKEEDIISTSRNKKEWDYGGAYIRGAQCNMLKIKNNNALIDKKVLIFRDSYEAPLTWLMADMFSEVQIVDPRNIENIDLSYEEIIKYSGADTIMIMFNSFGFDTMIDKMIERM